MSAVSTLFWLARPAGTPLVVLLPFLGYAFAHWNRDLPLHRASGMAAVCGAWVLAHAGTLWLNAALDRDDGGVLFGRSVTVPSWIRGPGLAAVAVSVPVAAVGSPGSGACALACAVLAVLYSHPSTRWKAHPVLGPLVNVVGYGLLSPAAGWFVVGASPTLRTLLVLPLAPLWVAAGYLAAQAFQADDDRARGYRTFVVVYGPRATLSVTRVLVGLTYGWVMVLAVAGYFPRGVSVPAAGAWWILDRWLVRWMEVPGGGDVRWASGFVARVLALGAVMMVFVLADHLWHLSLGLPGAGLATAVGAR